MRKNLTRRNPRKRRPRKKPNLMRKSQKRRQKRLLVLVNNSLNWQARLMKSVNF